MSVATRESWAQQGMLTMPICEPCESREDSDECMQSTVAANFLHGIRALALKTDRYKILKIS